MGKLKPGLGRGLDALIKPQEYVTNSKESVDLSTIKDDDGKQVDVLARISVDFISRNPYQPRSHFNQEALDELKKSILSNGLIQPITVRRTPEHKYQLISGERRWIACKEIGYKEIPAYIIEVESDELMLALALIENIQREKLNPLEIGLAYKRLMDECHLTQEQIAEKVGKDRTTVANSIRLLKLPDEVQQAIITDQITSGHARALINLPSAELQVKVLQRIVKDNYSVRKVEKLVKDYTTGSGKQGSGKTFTISSKWLDSGANIKDMEEKLRKVFGTKVSCKQRQDGTGEIMIEFYSNAELERLYELFEIIDKNYN